MILLDLSKEYEIIAKKWGVSPETVRKVEQEIFKSTRREIASDSGFNILLHRFGTFEIKRNALDRYEEKLDEAFEMGTITEARYKKGKSNLELYRNNGKEE